MLLFLAFYCHCCRYFPSLTHLSLVSCNLITDKSLMQLLPCKINMYMNDIHMYMYNNYYVDLPNLSFLNLNECQQISDESLQNFKST